jgi:3-oxoacyl-[acyl-carrier-protein] synthase III
VINEHLLCCLYRLLIVCVSVVLLLNLHPWLLHLVDCCAGTCILFGDGCGAVVVSAAPDGESCSLLGVDMHSDGNGQKSLHAMYSGCGGKPFQVCVHVRRDDA